MRESYPYVSGAGNLSKIVSQFRKNLPSVVNAETLKKLAIAPNNESYVLNTLKFLRLLDDKGKSTIEATEVFSNRADSEFESAFAKLVKIAYSELFELHGEQTWNLTNDALITFFRKTDKTSEAIGHRQSMVFQTLANLGGKRVSESPLSGNQNIKKKKVLKPKESKVIEVKGTDIVLSDPQSKSNSSSLAKVGLSVRIEVNLPTASSQETYDLIFKSIRENLLND